MFRSLDVIMLCQAVMAKFKSIIPTPMKTNKRGATQWTARQKREDTNNCHLRGHWLESVWVIQNTKGFKASWVSTVQTKFKYQQCIFSPHYIWPTGKKCDEDREWMCQKNDHVAYVNAATRFSFWIMRANIVPIIIPMTVKNRKAHKWTVMHL